MNDLISIIVPVYNAEKYLSATIQSICAQTYQNWELILVDDASTDGSLQVLREYEQSIPNLHVIAMKKNGGPAAARNRGVLAAKGHYLVYQDADDLWHPEKLQKQYEFTKDHQYAFTFTGYEFADEDGTPNGKVVHVPASIQYEEALKNTTISTITVMFDTTQIPQELLMMPVGIRGEDTGTWWQILRNGYTAYGLDECLSIYRRYAGSRSSNKLKAVWGTWRLYRKQEKMNMLRAGYYFVGYVLRAVKRRVGKIMYKK